MGNKHTFIDVSAYLSRPITHNPEEEQNINECVLIAHNALYNKIHVENADAEKHLAGSEVLWS